MTIFKLAPFDLHPHWVKQISGGELKGPSWKRDVERWAPGSIAGESYTRPLGKISLPFEGEAGRGMRNFGDSVDGSRLGQTLSGAACGGFVQTSSHWRKRNARGGCLRYILDCLKDVLNAVPWTRARLGHISKKSYFIMPRVKVSDFFILK